MLHTEHCYFFQSTFCDSYFTVKTIVERFYINFQSTFCDSQSMRLLVVVLLLSSSFNPLFVIRKKLENSDNTVKSISFQSTFCDSVEKVLKDLEKKKKKTFNPLFVIPFSLIRMLSVYSILFRVFQNYHWNMFSVFFLMIMVF